MRIDFALKLTECHSEVEMKVVCCVSVWFM